MKTDIYKSIIERCHKHIPHDNLTDTSIMLTPSEMNDFMKEINIYFPGYQNLLQNKYGIDSQAELEYCCLSLIDIKESCKAALLGISYSGLITRRNRAATSLNCNAKDIMTRLNQILGEHQYS